VPPTVGFAWFRQLDGLKGLSWGFYCNRGLLLLKGIVGEKASGVGFLKRKREVNGLGLVGFERAQLFLDLDAFF
jgi:hypothetical protein